MQIVSVTKGISMHILVICCNFTNFCVLGFSLVFRNVHIADFTVGSGRREGSEGLSFFVACFAVGCLSENKSKLLFLKSG